MLKIYHNPRCSKSRAGLEYLKLKTSGFELIDYLKDGLTEAMVHEILLKSNLQAEDIVRKHEELYIKELKGKKFTEKEWVQIIVENPKLLQRPFLVTKHKAIHGVPVENIDSIL